MGSEGQSKQARRARRKFTEEFKAGAARLVIEEGRPVAQVAKDFDLTETALRSWVQRVRDSAGKEVGALSASEREELTRLRRELRQVKMEREILKKAAAWFAQETKAAPNGSSNS